MNRKTDHDTREHLLSTGEKLALERGFTGMGLSELLRTASVPKGSFYHYFSSKEAFGTAMLRRYYATHGNYLTHHFSRHDVSARELVLEWYRTGLKNFCDNGMSCNCLTVKLSAEVCDLSEEMRQALDNGAASVITLLANTLARGRDDEHSMTFDGDILLHAEALYALWLGATLQAKISRSAVPLESALLLAERIISSPA